MAAPARYVKLETRQKITAQACVKRTNWAQHQVLGFMGGLCHIG